MNRWTIGAFALLVVVVVTGGYICWRAISDLGTQVEAWTGQVEAMATGLAEVDSSIAALELQTASLQADVAALQAVAPPHPVDLTEIESRIEIIELAQEETATSLGLTMADLADTSGLVDNHSEVLADVITDITTIDTNTSTLATGLDDIGDAINDLQACISYLLSPNIEFLPTFC